MKIPFFLIAASLIFIECGPKYRQGDPLNSQYVKLECGNRASSEKIVSDSVWNSNIVFEEVPVSCRWEGTSFKLYKRDSDESLFYRPLFKIVDSPEVDELGDPSGRTLVFRVKMTVPNLSIACETDEGYEKEYKIQTAKPMPLTRAKIWLESPISSSSCEIGDGTILLSFYDDESIRLVLPDADAAKRVYKYISKKPSQISLGIEYETIGLLRRPLCKIDDSKISSFSKKFFIEHFKNSGLIVDDNAVLYVTSSVKQELEQFIFEEVSTTIINYPGYECGPEIAWKAAEGYFEAWKTRNVTPQDSDFVGSLSKVNASNEEEKEKISNCIQTIEEQKKAGIGGSVSALGVDINAGYSNSKNIKVAAECSGEFDIYKIELTDIDKKKLQSLNIYNAENIKFVETTTVRGGSCIANCIGCCDERGDCIERSYQTNDKCGTGNPGEQCIGCLANKICNQAKGKCELPPYMNAKYDLFLVSVTSTNCDATSECDLNIYYKLTSDSEFKVKNGPSDVNHVFFDIPLVIGAAPETLGSGIELYIKDRDVFVDDIMGDCVVKITYKQLEEAANKLDGINIINECGSSLNKLILHLELSKQR